MTLNAKVNDFAHHGRGQQVLISCTPQTIFFCTFIVIEMFKIRFLRIFFFDFLDNSILVL